MTRISSTRISSSAFSLTRRKMLGALALVPFAGLAVSNAFAAAPALKLTSEDQADLARVATYLDGIHTMRARFQQVAAGGGLAQGKIYLRRPGLMRVEYEPPVPVLLVADGLWVNYYDSELDQLTQIPISQTPIWFLLQATIDFSPKITVTNIERSPGAVRISVYQTENPDAGSASLTFADEPLQLKQWSITDSQGTRIEIALQDAVFGGALANDLFATPRTKKTMNGGSKG